MSQKVSTPPDSADQSPAPRIDKWLWAVRVYRTRSLATEACRAGHVRVGGHTVKPSYTPKLGDMIEARVGERERKIEVTGFLDKRVGAGALAPFIIDHTPPPDPREKKLPNFIPVPMRDRGAGRPTKKERRQLDSLSE